LKKLQIFKNTFLFLLHKRKMSRAITRKLVDKQRISLINMITKRIAVGTHAQILTAYPFGSRKQPLAIKQIKSGVESIEHEVDALIACQDIPSVVDCLDVIEEENYTYIVMPHYDRSLLDVVLAGGSMPQEQVHDIISDLLQTVISCHEHGVAHLDIKPDNLMKDGDGNTILIDFGSSHKFDGEDLNETYLEEKCLLVETRTKTNYGTEEYAAPELSESTFSPTKSDMWGVAATAVSLLTGEFPEIGMTCLDEYVHVDSSLRQVITQGMQVDVSERISPPEALSALIDG